MRDEALRVSERQKKFEDSCQEIGEDLHKQIAKLPFPCRFLAQVNLVDLFDCIRMSYHNGRADEKEGIS